MLYLFVARPHSQAAITGQVPLSGQTVPGAQTITAGVPAHIPPDGGAQVLEHQKESKVPVLDQNIVSQLPREERETLTAKQREAKELEQQVTSIP